VSKCRLRACLPIRIDVGSTVLPNPLHKHLVLARIYKSAGNGGRGGAVFVGKRSYLVVEETVVANSSAESLGGGMYSDERSHMDLSGVSFLDLSAGTNGGGYYASSQVTVNMRSADFQRCSSALAGGAAYLGSNVSANMFASTIRDCRARDGGGLHLNGSVTLNLSHTIMERNVAFGSRGGALNAAGALGRNTITIQGGMFVNNSAAEYGGMSCLWPSSAMMIDGLAKVVGSTSGRGAGIYAREASSVVLQDVVLRGGAASAIGGGVYIHTGSHLAAFRSSIHGNSAVTDGGGVYALTSCTVDLREGASVSGNKAGNRAGGIYLSSQSTLTVTGSAVSGNMAENSGGGLYMSQSTLSVSGSAIDGNRAGGSGGGAYASSSAVDLRNSSSVINNSAADCAGGLYLSESKLTVSRGAIDGNRAGGNGGGVYAVTASTVDLREGASVRDNTAFDRGGGVYMSTSKANLQDGACVSGNMAETSGGGLYVVSKSTLSVSQSAIDGNRAGASGGGAYVYSSSTANLQDGACVSGNMAENSGGGLYVSQSTLSVSGSAIDRNSAGGSGGGAYASSSSAVNLQDGASFRGNTAALTGGGLSLQESTLTVARSDIDGNSAGGDGGGVCAQTSSIVTLGDGTSLLRNTARNNGGGLGLLKSSSLATAGSVRLCWNAAIGIGSIGGGIAASTSILRLGAGATDFSNNTAAVDGGALALIEGSTLSDSGDPALSCLLTVRHNTAETGSGGGMVVSGDSSVALGASTAVFSQNTAAQQGGGLFIRAGQAEFDSSKATYLIAAKITLLRLDLVDNAATTGDGGGDEDSELCTGHERLRSVLLTDMSLVIVAGLCAYSLVNLLPGGHTNATGNSAARGGAAALVDATLIVQLGHTLTAQRNAAHRHGGAIALLSGAALVLLEPVACPAKCASSSRGRGSCSHECMSLPCNWDGGDCVNTRMNVAGSAAGQVCDRETCSIFGQTNAEATVGGCSSGCFTAACDWGRDTCVEPRANVQACPLIDAAAYASIKTVQR
jgi:hypothetical protein